MGGQCLATCFVNWRQIILYHRVLIVIHSHQTNFNAHRACLPMVTRWQARDSSWIAYTDDDPPVSANGICIDSFTYDDASKSLHRSNYMLFFIFLCNDNLPHYLLLLSQCDCSCCASIDASLRQSRLERMCRAWVDHHTYRTRLIIVTPPF